MSDKHKSTETATIEINSIKGYQPKPSGQPEGKKPPKGGSNVSPPQISSQNQQSGGQTESGKQTE